MYILANNPLAKPEAPTSRHIYTYTSTHTSTNTSKYTWRQISGETRGTYKHACMQTYAATDLWRNQRHIQAHMHANIRGDRSLAKPGTYKHTYMHIHTYTSTHISTHTRIYSHIQTHIQTHIYAHIQAHKHEILRC